MSEAQANGLEGSEATHLCSMPLYVEQRALDVDERTFDAVASTDAVDGHGDIVKQDFDLKRFKKNPVVLFAHNSHELPIRKATRIRVEKDSDGRRKLMTTIKLADAEANPLAENVLQSMNQGTLRALSIGFRPGEVKVEEVDGIDRFVLSKNTLYELSVVPVPANAETLARVKAMATRGAIPPAAERGDGEQENETMTTEEQAALTKAQVDRDVAVKERDAFKEKASKLEDENKRLAKGLEKTIEERDVAIAERDASDAKVVEADVAKLVGKKITPAEKPAFIALAKSDKKLFDQMVAQRPNLKLLDARVTAADTEPEDVNADGASAGLAEEIDEAAAE
jgi:HK97 family phage prohead protease